jgi:pimeloyl-ACP methyl ester carboxylesterase
VFSPDPRHCRLPLCTLLLSFVLDVSALTMDAASPGGKRNDPSSTARVRPLTINSSIDDLLEHPAFKGFGRLLLPWDDRPHDATLQLKNIGYSLWGSSAGARMAASVGSSRPKRFGGADVPKPSTVVMAYTGHSDVSFDEPATFVVVGENDRIASASAMETRVSRLRKNGAKVEFHRYPNVGHGFGLGVGTSAEGWIYDAVRFWISNLEAPNEDSQS